MADAPLIDIYSGLDHKEGMGSGSGSSGIDAAPKYLPDPDKRRINAYARLSAYLETVAREFLTEQADDPGKKAAWREFGDASVLARQIATSVLGQNPIVSIVGADRPVPEAPDIPMAPKAPVTEGLSDQERRIADEVYTRSLELWETNAQKTLEDWLADTAEVPVLQERQEWLRAWAVDDRFVSKVTEAELESIVPLGDGVYVVSWDPARKRVKTEIFEPDAYVPVLDTAERSEFPEKVHLVWQFSQKDAQGKDQIMVRRVTYELIELKSLDDGGPAFDVGARPGYLAPEDPWTHVCVLTDGVVALDAFEEVDGVAKGFQFRKVRISDTEEVELNQYPTGLDFIPVVHVPHTLNNRTHFGRSPLTVLAQLFDELAAADTDEALAAGWAARPPMGISGLGLPASGQADTVAIAPGKGYRLADGGRVSSIDMAGHLEGLGERIKALLKRLSVNGRVPEGMLGRVDASEVPSGLALTLSFTSFEQMIEGARLVRAEKYQLLLKMVQRIAIQNGDESLAGSTEVFPAELTFGTFMPQDLLGEATVLEILVRAHLVSQESALKRLQDAGMPVEDLAAELASIRAGMAETAEMISAATGVTRLGAEFLGYGPEDLEGVEVGTAVPPGAGVPPVQ